MPTDDELRDFLAGRMPPEDAEEIDSEVRGSVALQARVATLPTDPMIERLRKVWSERKLVEEQHDDAADRPTDQELEIIDRYRLIELIGSGGMGQVWKARPLHGADRMVALKLVKPGLDSKSIIQRFELERKTLAMMDHPCIAKVLDGGATDRGQSYFVMELVDGAPITVHCDEHRLGIDQRLKLFVQVCRAVQHAHQKGIIHRDLKPSNLLVTQYDGQALPKVIDFGLAKALDSMADAWDRSQLTEYGALVGTVRYMSPEQVKLNSWDIDTRSDIYSLGIVLYELLTGSTPIQATTDVEQSLLDKLQAIREVEPPRPSERLNSTVCFGATDQVGGDRMVRQILRRDLDWIVMKAIEKDRDRRYETADALAQDIERYLSDQPIAARPPSLVYRLEKFLKKHRSAVTITAALLVAAIVGFASLLWSAQADSQKRAVYSAASYSAIINELNLLSVSRQSGWTHRGLQLIREASSIPTPLRDKRQLRDWAASLLTIPDFDMNMRARFVGDSSPTDMAYSPSGRRLAVGLATTDARQQLTVVLIDLDTQQQRSLTLDTSQLADDEGGDRSVTSLRFGQDDNTLFVGTRNGLLLRLLLEQPQPVVACKRASRGGVMVRLSRDGRYCVTVTSRQQKLPGEHDERMRCFDATTLEQLGVSDGNARVKSLSIAPDSSRACIFWDNGEAERPGSLEYSLPTLEQSQSFPGPHAEYDPLGYAVFTGANGTYKRISFDKSYDPSIYLPGTALAWTPERIPTFQHFQVNHDGTMLAATAQAEHCIFLWHEAESIPLMKFRLAGNESISGFALAPKMESMAVITEEALEIYDFTNRAEFRKVYSLPSRPRYFAVAPDQSEFAMITDDQFYRYRFSATDTVDSRKCSVSSLARNAIAYGPTNSKLAMIQSDGQATGIKICDTRRLTADVDIPILNEPEERFSAVKLAGLGWIDDSHLVAAIDFRLLVIDAASGRIESATPKHNPGHLLPSYISVAFRHKQCVTLTNEGTLDVWQLAGSDLIRSQPSIELHTSAAEQLAWHPSKDYVIVGTQSGSIFSVDLKSRRFVFKDDKLHVGEICGAAWCDAERLVTASRDGKLVLWQHHSGWLDPYAAWDTRSGIIGLALSRDGKTCYAASASQSISVFQLAALDREFERLGIAESTAEVVGN